MTKPLDFPNPQSSLSFNPSTPLPQPSLDARDGDDHLFFPPNDFGLRSAHFKRQSSSFVQLGAFLLWPDFVGVGLCCHLHGITQTSRRFATLVHGFICKFKNNKTTFNGTTPGVILFVQFVHV